MGKMGDDSDAVREVLEEAAAKVSDSIYQAETDLISWFRDEGTQVNEIDRKPFQDAVLPKLTDWDKVPYDKEQFDRLQAL
jgi:TRAP-type C4-dicarboxylate transport system substrate-binding protein